MNDEGSFGLHASVGLNGPAGLGVGPSPHQEHALALAEAHRCARSAQHAVAGTAALLVRQRSELQILRRALAQTPVSSPLMGFSHAMYVAPVSRIEADALVAVTALAESPSAALDEPLIRLAVLTQEAVGLGHAVLGGDVERACIRARVIVRCAEAAGLSEVVSTAVRVLDLLAEGDRSPAGGLGQAVHALAVEIDRAQSIQFDS
ncbi:hypothetical protein [Xanthomonas sp. NCPPB 2632]|jgi:hypothetical protein|uniref:hypothetical protein n=1 Tax=Xanthomonas sp. NCPPB 2632 TaxID=3240912 RepID=UPI003517E137